MEIFSVQLSRRAEKQLEKLPEYIVLKLAAWIEEVGVKGINEVRKIPGYHDEPLKGERKGQRSIRLSRHYRAIYEISDGKISFIMILEVNKHEY
jgi:proteic killer suppression protein